MFTFNPSNQVSQVRVPLTDDGVYELTETFTAGLSFLSADIPLVTFSPSEATVTLSDDESKYCDNKIQQYYSGHYAFFFSSRIWF